MTGFDLGVVAITLISGLLAMIRGFVREILSILSWVTAAAVTVLLLPYAAPTVEGLIEPEWLAESVTALVIFTLVLVGASVVTFQLGERVPEGHVGALDRTGGFLFGLIRGFILVTVAYIFIAFFVAREDYPSWLAEARLLPVVSAAAETLSGWVSPPPDARQPATRPTARQSAAGSAAETGPEDEQEPTADTDEAEGYNAEERRRLDQLFESVGRNGDT